MTYRSGRLLSADGGTDYFGAPDAKPDHVWVYLHIAADSALLYIGRTSDPLRRMKEHAKTSAWYSQINRVVWFGPMDEINGAAVEREFITVEQPLNNVRHVRRQIAASGPAGEFLTITETRALLGCSLSTVMRYLRDGRLTRYRTGSSRTVHIKADEARALLEIAS